MNSPTVSTRPSIEAASVLGPVPAGRADLPTRGLGVRWPTAEASVQEADRLAVRLRAALDRIAIPLARASQAFVSRRQWRVFGYARLDDFGRECFRRSGRWLRDLASLGDSLERLPGLRLALAGDDGGAPLGWVAATWIGRVATSASLSAWVTLAREVTVRELREVIRAARAASSHWPPGHETDSENADSGSSELVTVPAAPEERGTVRLSVPRPIRAAFDETLDLHRAVEGSEVTVGAFVEALAAEALAGDPAPDVRVAPATHRSRLAREDALARSNDGWRDLPSVPRSRAELDLACPELQRLRDLEAEAGAGRARDLEDRIRELLVLEETIQIRLGRLLTEMSDRRAWAALGFADAGHYARERLGMSRSNAEKRCRLERAKRRHPKLRRAHEQGFVGSESALLLAQILRREPVDGRTESTWVSHAMCTSVKRLRDELRYLGRTAWEVERAGERTLPPDDETWHRSLRREAGTARGRVLLLGRQAAADPTADVFLRLRLTHGVAGDFRVAVESARRRLADQVAPTDVSGGPAGDTGGDLPPSAVAAQTFAATGRPIPAWVGLLALIEDFVAVWDDPRGMPKRRDDAIYIRDGWRCMAPGCTSRRNLEDHHVLFRSRGGDDEPSNRICICRFHHQQGVHGGLARCHGTAPLGVVWELGRTGEGETFRNERRPDPTRGHGG